jgi:hypothetical protein
MIKPKYIGKDGIAIFTTTQIDDYGTPESNGWTDKYYVVESVELIGKPTYAQELQYRMERPPIHRYSRLTRFKMIVGQLLGHIGFVTERSKDMADEVGGEVSQFYRDYTPPCMVWETLRKVLKDNKRQIFYNRIHALAKRIGMIDHDSKITSRQWNALIEDFDSMHEIFPRIRHKLQRKYFPNLRFIALKLLKRHKVHLVIDVPLTRTPCKLAALEEDFSTIWQEIEDEWLEFLL